MKRTSIFTLLTFALTFILALHTQDLQAQPPGETTGSGTLNVVPNTDGPTATVKTTIQVGWDEFEDVSPSVKRASINEASLNNALFGTETEIGPQTNIELRTNDVGEIWVWVCHRVRICKWYCGWCCVPTWITVCFRSNASIDSWDSGTQITLDLLEDAEFIDGNGNLLTVTAEGTSLDLVVP